jgi:hypothetical protein
MQAFGRYVAITAAVLAMGCYYHGSKRVKIVLPKKNEDELYVNSSRIPKQIGTQHP